MGNICRSPLAEGLFIHHAAESSSSHLFEVDSAGTGGWHAGDPPDQRSIDVARRHGVSLDSQARQVVVSDFKSFDLLICMDDQNVRDLAEMGCNTDKIRTLMSYVPDSKYSYVPDPYYGGDEGFELMHSLIDSAVLGLIQSFESGSGSAALGS
jgi:protein-tyrosine phosphatase